MEGSGGKGEVVINALDRGEECLGCCEAAREDLMEVTCGCVACVVCHCRDGKREVTLYEDGCSPPHRPGVISFGIGSVFWRADRVEFRVGRVSGVLKDKDVGLGLESEGVVVNFGWEEGDAIVAWQLSISPSLNIL